MSRTCLKLFFGGVRVLLPPPRPEEDGGDGEHGYDDEDVEAAAHLLRYDEHLAEAGVERELDHLATQLSQLTRVVQRAQDPQLPRNEVVSQFQLTSIATILYLPYRSKMVVVTLFTSQ